MNNENALFIFRRDLRLEDNTGLIFALENFGEVIPCFIFTPDQIDQNPYRSDHCLQFMIDSLQDLDHQLKLKKSRLYLFCGKPEEVVSKLVKEVGIDGVVVNRDYTPYSIQRDLKIEEICKKNKISFQSFDDALLHPPEDTLKSNGQPYTIFTPFFRNASKLSVESPEANLKENYWKGVISFAKGPETYEKILPQRSSCAKGGRAEALKILNALSQFSNYGVMRDFPSEAGTTHLSAHLKFTTCSPREVHEAMKKQLGIQSELIRSLYWRDFFTSTAFYFPHVFKGAFHEKFDQLPWDNRSDHFEKWCQGQTGFPIIDAGMREMNQTGYMHNRVRMVVAAFLVKDLHINWQWGEKYFAQTLVDYDPAVNNGNWQWAASTGCDAQPYFRIFNPWNQQKKFDPDCKYIKQWVPELAKLPARIIHEWNLENNHAHCLNYVPPMIDHALESKRALEIYKAISVLV